MTADDRLASTLAGIRERADWALGRFADMTTVREAVDDIESLLAAIDKALEKADEWEAESDECEARKHRIGTDEEAVPILEGEAIAYYNCAQDLREAITRGLAGAP